MEITMDIKDLTKFEGGIVFYHIAIGKLSPARANEYIQKQKISLEPITKYLESQGYVTIFVPSSNESSMEVWGMKNPYLEEKEYPTKAVCEWVKEQQDFDKAKHALDQ